MIYACEICGQNQTNSLFQRISRLQKKALSIINFKRYDTPSDTLFKENKILKISDFIKCINVEFARKCAQQESLSIFNEIFHTLNFFKTIITTSGLQIKSNQIKQFIHLHDFTNFGKY